MSMPARVRLVAMLLVLGLSALARGADTEHWFRVLVSGSPAGWMRGSETTADGKITTQADMSFKLGRGPTSVSISMKSEFVETTDGKPVSMMLRQEIAKTPVVTTYVFGPDGIKVETTQAGRTTTSTRPLPAQEWKTPAAGSRELKDRIARGDKEITIATIDPMGGVDVVKMKHKILGPETITVDGKPVQTIKATVESSAAPGIVSTEYLDEESTAVRSDTAMGGIELRMVRAGPEVKNDSGPAPELMISTFVKPDRPIEHPRTTTRATYVLSLPDGAMPEIPTTGAQRPEELAGGQVKLSIDTGDLRAAPPADVESKAFLASTATSNLEDPEVTGLSRRALANAGVSTTDRAEILRRFVHKHINKKSLDVGFATASEVARTRAGDCSEHGVLLAALLRADGIPSRVAVGVIYVDEFAGSSGIFGYHMWAQALLEQDGKCRWVDLDATLPDATPFDAAHITLAVSDLDDNSAMDSMASLLNVLGKLKIKVESVK